EIATNWYFTVPKGYEALLPFFRADARLRETFFSRLKVLWFAGAALSQSVFDEMQELALATCGERIMFLTGLGSTESAPMAIARMWQSRDSTNMGVPVPGVELKLVPSEGKLEARLRGPNIMPGYWRQRDLTAQAFDDEGFYKLGDALKFEDPGDARAGLLFDGRVAEDFKLTTGTWVNVGPLRARLLAQLEPYARDVVIAGADRDEIGALIFPHLEACRKLAAAAAALTCASRLHKELSARLAAFARTSTGSSNRVCRAILVGEPPSLDAGEMTDKGSINQRAVLERRANLVAELYAPQPSPRVLVLVEGAWRWQAGQAAWRRAGATSGCLTACARRSQTITAPWRRSPPPISASRRRAKCSRVRACRRGMSAPSLPARWRRRASIPTACRAMSGSIPTCRSRCRRTWCSGCAAPASKC